MAAEWGGSLWEHDPDNFWTDDETGELVCARTGRRLPAVCAAAPDLLAALKELVLVTKAGIANKTENEQKTIAAAKAAIAKAKGEEAS